MRANSLRVGSRLWIFDEFESTHVSLKTVECVRRKREALRYEMHKVLRQVVDLAYVFFHKLLSTRMLWILDLNVSNQEIRQGQSAYLIWTFKPLPERVLFGPRFDPRGTKIELLGLLAMSLREMRMTLTSRRSVFAAVVSAPRRV